MSEGGHGIYRGCHYFQLVTGKTSMGFCANTVQVNIKTVRSIPVKYNILEVKYLFSWRYNSSREGVASTGQGIVNAELCLANYQDVNSKLLLPLLIRLCLSNSAYFWPLPKGDQDASTLNYMPTGPGSPVPDFLIITALQDVLKFFILCTCTGTVLVQWDLDNAILCISHKTFPNMKGLCYHLKGSLSQ